MRTEIVLYRSSDRPGVGGRGDFEPKPWYLKNRELLTTHWERLDWSEMVRYPELQLTPQTEGEYRYKNLVNQSLRIFRRALCDGTMQTKEGFLETVVLMRMHILGYKPTDHLHTQEASGLRIFRSEVASGDIFDYVTMSGKVPYSIHRGDVYEVNLALSEQNSKAVFDECVVCLGMIP